MCVQGAACSSTVRAMQKKRLQHLEDGARDGLHVRGQLQARELVHKAVHHLAHLGQPDQFAQLLQHRSHRAALAHTVLGAEATPGRCAETTRAVLACQGLPEKRTAACHAGPMQIIIMLPVQVLPGCDGKAHACGATIQRQLAFQTCAERS